MKIRQKITQFKDYLKSKGSQQSQQSEATQVSTDIKQQHKPSHRSSKEQQLQHGTLSDGADGSIQYSYPYATINGQHKASSVSVEPQEISPRSSSYLSNSREKTTKQGHGMTIFIRDDTTPNGGTTAMEVSPDETLGDIFKFIHESMYMDKFDLFDGVKSLNVDQKTSIADLGILADAVLTLRPRPSNAQQLLHAFEGTNAASKLENWNTKSDNIKSKLLTAN